MDESLRNSFSKNGCLGSIPMHRIKRVDKPTTEIYNSIKKVKARASALSRAARGELGLKIQKQFLTKSESYPLIGASYAVIRQFAAIEKNEVEAKLNFIPDDPEILSRHIKRTGLLSTVRHLRRDVSKQSNPNR
jgi:hypothetical protein